MKYITVAIVNITIKILVIVSKNPVDAINGCIEPLICPSNLALISGPTFKPRKVPIIIAIPYRDKNSYPLKYLAYSNKPKIIGRIKIMLPDVIFPIAVFLILLIAIKVACPMAPPITVAVANLNNAVLLNKKL
jgi:hypothetical protein